MQSWKWEEKIRLDSRKKDVQSENDRAEQHRLPEGTALQRRHQTSQNQRGRMMKGLCDDRLFPDPKERAEHPQNAATQTPQLSALAPATAYCYTCSP